MLNQQKPCYGTALGYPCILTPMLFFLKHKFSSYWMVQETSGLRKPTLLGVDPQNEFHLSKQVSLAYRMTSWFTRKPFFGVKCLFSIHFG